jgi:dihydrofolate reductase
VLIAGGAATVRQYLGARLVDEIQVSISPILLGRGESLFAGLDLPALGYRVADRVVTDAATHVCIGRER